MNDILSRFNSSIFEKNLFSLKEFCKTFHFLSYEISDITHCYYYFSSNNSKYRQYLNNTRNYKGEFLINNNKISFREILQRLDIEFTKLVIRIKTETKEYDVHISWDNFERIFINITKNDLLQLYQSIQSK